MIDAFAGTLQQSAATETTVAVANVLNISISSPSACGDES
jgi:hypothetical protein